MAASAPEVQSLGVAFEGLGMRARGSGQEVQGLCCYILKQLLSWPRGDHHCGHFQVLSTGGAAGDTRAPVSLGSQAMQSKRACDHGIALLVVIIVVWFGEILVLTV